MRLSSIISVIIVSFLFLIAANCYSQSVNSLSQDSIIIRDELTTTDGGDSLVNDSIVSAETNEDTTTDIRLSIVRWDSITAIIIAFLGLIGSIISAYFTTKKTDHQGYNSKMIMYPFISMTITLFAIMYFMIIALPNMFQSNYVPLTENDINERIESRLNQEFDDFEDQISNTDMQIQSTNSELDSIKLSISSLRQNVQSSLSEIDQLMNAIPETRERLPTESYLLSGYSSLEDDYQEISAGIERNEASIGFVNERQEFHSYLVFIILIILYLTLPLLWYSYYRFKGNYEKKYTEIKREIEEQIESDLSNIRSQEHFDSIRRILSDYDYRNKENNEHLKKQVIDLEREIKKLKKS